MACSQRTYSSDQKRIAVEYETFLVKYNEILSNRSKMLDALNASLSAGTIIAEEKIDESEKYFELLKSDFAYMSDKNNNAYPIGTSFSGQIETTFSLFNQLFKEMGLLYPIRNKAIQAKDVGNISAYNGYIKIQNDSEKDFNFAF